MATIQQFLNSYPPEMAYYLVAGMLFFGCMGTPINSDLVLIVSGVMTGLGHFNSLYLVPITIIAIVLGDSVVFKLGQRFGPFLLKKKITQKLFPEKRVRETSRLIESKGKFAFVLCRVLPGMRTITFFVAATLGTPYSIFLIFNSLALMIWAPLLHYIGLTAGNHLDTIVQSIKQGQFILLGLIFGLLGYFVFFRKRKVSQP